MDETKTSNHFQCIFCKKVLTGHLDDNFSDHLKFHNVSSNQEFLFATFFLNPDGIEKTVEFMMNNASDTFNEKQGNAVKDELKSLEDEDNSICNDGSSKIETEKITGSPPRDIFDGTSIDDIVDCSSSVAIEDSNIDAIKVLAEGADLTETVNVNEDIITTINVDVVSNAGIIKAAVKDQNLQDYTQGEKEESLDVNDNSNESENLFGDADTRMYRKRRRLVCDCDVVFTSYAEKQRHFNMFHREFKCDLCPLTFPTEKLLDAHRMNPKDTHDVDYKSTTCSICHVEFKDYRFLKDHKKSVHGIGESKKCTYCDEIVTNMKKHLRKFHFMLYECGICGKNVKNLQKHFLTMHGSEEDKKFRCEICGKGFITQDKVNAHMAVHSSDRPYKCKLGCGYATKTLGNLKKHEESGHTQNRKYPWNNNKYQQDFSKVNSYDHRQVNPNFKLREVSDEISVDQTLVETEENTGVYYIVDTDTAADNNEQQFIKIEPVSKHIFKSETSCQQFLFPEPVDAPVITTVIGDIQEQDEVLNVNDTVPIDDDVTSTENYLQIEENTIDSSMYSIVS